METSHERGTSCRKGVHQGKQSNTDEENENMDTDSQSDQHSSPFHSNAHTSHSIPPSHTHIDTSSFPSVSHRCMHFTCPGAERGTSHGRGASCKGVASWERQTDQGRGADRGGKGRDAGKGRRGRVAELLVTAGELGEAEVLVAVGEVGEAVELVEAGVLPGEAVLVLQKQTLYGRL